MMTLIAEVPNLPKEVKDPLVTAQICSEQLLVVINDILDLTQMSTKKMRLERRPINLLETMEESLEIVSFEANKKGLELILDVDLACPLFQWETVLGDSTRLRQLLVNLLNNAVKFSNVGDIVVNAHLERIVEIEQEDQPAQQYLNRTLNISSSRPTSRDSSPLVLESSYPVSSPMRTNSPVVDLPNMNTNPTRSKVTKYEVQFSVADQGIGIPSSAKANIFEAFNQVTNQLQTANHLSSFGLSLTSPFLLVSYRKQVDTSITRRFGGAGLGLCIAKQLSELMGGKLRISSFSLILPI